MNRALRSADDLLSAGLISGAEADALGAVLARYAVSVTPDMAELIDPQDPDDPIGRQFVPRVAEAVATPEERADPIGDAAHAPVTGIVHRYPDRVLLKPLHVCPVYCRFCFRREMVGPDGLGTLTDAELDAALAALPSAAHRRAAVGYYRAMVRPSRPTARYADLHSYRFAVPRVPILHLQGAQDGAMIADYAATLGDVLPAGSQVHTLPTAGHFLQIEEPQAAAEAVLRYLGDRSDAR